MVLLEAALAVPLLLVLAIAGLGLVRLGIGELAVVAAARDAAVLAGRHAGEADILARVHQSLPSARVQVQTGEEQVRVVVRDATRLPVLLGSVRVEHTASFSAVREPRSQR